MSDHEGTAAQGHGEDKQRLESEIEKEINKLKYFLEEADDLIQLKDNTEVKIVTRRAEKIVDKLSDLVSHTEELKIDDGASSRSVRQWKKDVKSRYATLIADKKGFRKPSRKDRRKLTKISNSGDQKRKQQQEEERRAADLRTKQEKHERRI